MATHPSGGYPDAFAPPVPLAGPCGAATAPSAGGPCPGDSWQPRAGVGALPLRSLDGSQLQPSSGDWGSLEVDEEFEDLSAFALPARRQPDFAGDADSCASTDPTHTAREFQAQARSTPWHEMQDEEDEWDDTEHPYEQEGPSDQDLQDSAGSGMEGPEPCGTDEPPPELHQGFEDKGVQTEALPPGHDQFGLWSGAADHRAIASLSGVNHGGGAEPACYDFEQAIQRIRQDCRVREEQNIWLSILTLYSDSILDDFRTMHRREEELCSRMAIWLMATQGIRKWHMVD